MKKALLSFITLCGLLTAYSPLTATADIAETHRSYSFNELMAMSDDEVAGYCNTATLLECGFGDDSIDDPVKFEKYLNAPPSFYVGTNYTDVSYAAYKRFISGEARPYIVFGVDSGVRFSAEISADELGYPPEWDIVAVNGSWVTELNSGEKIIRPIHEYRMYVPVEVISDFETYVRLEASGNYFSDIIRNNEYGISYCEDINHQFASYGDMVAVIDGNLAGDANCDGKTTVADSVAVLQHIANRDKYGLSAQGLLNADVDGEAGVTANDARVLQEWDANK